MFEDLRRNIEQEKKIISDMKSIQISMQNSPENRNFYNESLNALFQQLYLLNRSVPELLKEWSPAIDADRANSGKQMPAEKKTVRMTYVSPSTKEKHYVTINKDDKKLFLERLRLSEASLKRLKKRKGKEEKSPNEFRKPRAFARISNKYFRRYSERLVPYFSSLAQDLKKGNLPVLLSTYLSMAMFSAVSAFFFGLILFIVLVIFSLNNWIYFWIPFGLSAFAMAAFYLYPASEASSVQKNISYELPFATIYMAAIASSDIEPTKIFKIIANSKEYIHIGREIKKVIVQTEIYGYDLVTALKNVAGRVSNKRLSELFSGLATNISTGGELKDYLEQKAQNFLLDYRLERQRYSDLAGTFMDVYISILIAAPLVLMMMFIVMNVAGLGLGNLGITTLLMISVIAIVVVNIIFLVILNIKQPRV